MWRRMILAVVLAVAAAGLVFSADFYGKIDIGWSALLQPDIQNSGARKGGFAALFQGLLGEENIKYGAEAGILEAYTAWNKSSIVFDNSLVLISTLGTIQYDFCGGSRIIPFLCLSAGPYFAINHVDDRTNGKVSSSSSSKAYIGGSLSAGAKIRLSVKNDLNLTCRYSRVHTTDNVALLSFFAGIGWDDMPFFKTGKTDNIQILIKDDNNNKKIGKD